MNHLQHPRTATFTNMLLTYILVGYVSSSNLELNMFATFTNTWEHFPVLTLRQAKLPTDHTPYKKNYIVLYIFHLHYDRLTIGSYFIKYLDTVF
jgi:hypothetical protein